MPIDDVENPAENADELTLEQAFALHTGEADAPADPSAQVQPDQPAEAIDGQTNAPAPQEIAQPEDVDTLRQQLHDAQEKLQREQGRTSALNRKLKEARETVQQGIKALPAVEQFAPMDDAALTEMAEVFPAAAQAFKAMQAQLASVMSSQTAQHTALQGVGQIQALEDARMAEASYSAAHAQLDTEVPGWREEIQTEAFNGWLQKQPPALQRCIESDSPDDAAYLIKAFRQHQAPATAQVHSIRDARQSALRQAAAPRTAPAPERKSATEFDSIEDAFNHWASQG